MDAMHSLSRAVSIALFALILIYVWVATRLGTIQRGAYFILLLSPILVNYLEKKFKNILPITLR